jgi:prenyltransferase beta subunit
MRRLSFALLVLVVCAGAARADDVADAREKGLDWLVKNQQKDGSWGHGCEPAVSSLATLAFLAARDEPFADDARGKALLAGIKYLIGRQKDGNFASEHWIHSQGFATLALAETLNACARCKTKPDLDAKALRETVAAAVKVIEKNQSTSGGWWYTPGSPNQHEGSTTVCAVQAIVAARNADIAIDEDVLKKGFDYLKKCQSKDGGFNYQLGDGRSMVEGTCADVATLGLMKKFDYAVMMNGYKFMNSKTPSAVSEGRFPYYGHFYGTLGMQLLGQEYADEKEYKTSTSDYITNVQKTLVSWQTPEGTWPLKGHMASSGETAYPVAFATLTLLVPEKRLSIFSRTAAKPS